MPHLAFISPAALWLILLLIPLWALALATPHRLSPTRFWISLIVRSALVLALVLALAGTQFVRPVQDIATVFLIDSSDSISASARARAEAFVQEALGEMDAGDRAAVVVFGENALVERAPSDSDVLGRILSTPLATRTDTEEAVQLGLALFPADAQKRLVLLSDGGQNTGDAMEAVHLATARNIPIDIVDLSGAVGGPEALVANLEAPNQVRDGQEIELIAAVESSVAQPSRLRVLHDQDVLVDQEVQLAEGTTRFSFMVQPQDQGFQRYRVQIEAANDGRVQNNEAAALVQVQGPPRVLLVEGTPGDATALRDALNVANMTAEVVEPQVMPADLAGLSAYDGVALINVPARSLPVEATALLQVYVRDLGKGLVMIGGEESFGVGGYGDTPVEKALPVYMDVRDREERPNLALVFVIDKSGSMAACHCSSPNRSSAQINQGSERKVDIAKEAVAQASTMLTAQDMLGIVAFDAGADSILPATRDVSVDQVLDAISGVQPDGTTNVRAGLIEAERMLQNADARIKHIVLLTDGWGSSGDHLGLARELYDQGITLTVVAAGSGSAEYLEQMANTGGGRYYPAEDMAEVPQIFLQETIMAVGNYIIEEPFIPTLTANSPTLAGIETNLPPLYGYNGSTIKETAHQTLAANDNAPILASWQYGLGRSIAWTSDTKGKWARDWVTWSEFPRFASQMVGWTLPTQTESAIQADLRVEGSETVLNVQVADAQGQPRDSLTLVATLVGGDGERRDVELTQVAPGKYHGSIPSPAPGTYLIQIAGSQDDRVIVQEVAGLVVPYSTEYQLGQSNPALLAEIRQAAGGRDLTDATDVFQPTNAVVVRAQEIALPLLWFVLILLPFDIGVRRLMLRRSDWSAARDQIARRFTSQPTAPVPASADPTIERLAQAKQRAAPRSYARPAPPEAATPTETPAPPSQRPLDHRESPTQTDAPDDAMARLRAAKERARKRARGEE